MKNGPPVRFLFDGAGDGVLGMDWMKPVTQLWQWRKPAVSQKSLRLAENADADSIWLCVLFTPWLTFYPLLLTCHDPIGRHMRGCMKRVIL